MKLNAPIPGSSLTREPGGSPWEQPPLYASGEEALAFYLDKFDDEETLDDLLFALESGYPVDSMVDFLTSYSVMEGYHTIDVKVMLSPILHEYICNLADAAGIPYVEEMGPTKEERMKAKDKKRTQALLKKALAEEGVEIDDNVGEAASLIAGSEEPATQESPPTPLIPRRPIGGMNGQ